jgi:hypothetical protein
MTAPEKFKLKDIGYGLIVPLIVGFIILAWPTVLNNAITDPTLKSIIIYGFPQMLATAVPLFIGLLWNKWAGGAAGFLVGGIFYAASSGYYSALAQINFYNEISQISWIVDAILIGYIAGALNNKSTSFKRMIGAGLTASIAVGFIQFYMYLISPMQMATDVFFTFYTSLLPMVIVGIVIPIVAKVFTWYGIMPGGHY